MAGNLPSISYICLERPTLSPWPTLHSYSLAADRRLLQMNGMTDSGFYLEASKWLSALRLTRK